jgi:hypothetical protein
METRNESAALAKAEEFIASVKEIDAIAARLRMLLSEPMPQDETWSTQVTTVAIDLRLAMVEAFELPPEEHVATAVSFLCATLEEAFAKLESWKDRGCQGDL